MKLIDFLVIAFLCYLGDLAANLFIAPSPYFFEFFVGQISALIIAYFHLNTKMIGTFFSRLCLFFKAAAKCWASSKEA